MTDSMPIAPPLVAVTRGAQVESEHRGAIAVATAAGETVAAIGDASQAVFPRSAIKAMQLLPFVASGGADRQGFTDADIAFACASHKGEPMHADRAIATLTRMTLGEDALECGPHWPTGPAAYREMVRAGGSASRLHNNCSGKHVAMLAAARDLGVPMHGYVAMEHPVQDRVRQTLEHLCDVDLSGVHPGIDGCGVPNWPMSLIGLATGFARIATGTGMAPAEARAARRILDACWAHPEMVSGTEGLDTAALRMGARRVFLKTGAEGVYCGALPEHGVGFALKIEDGALRASEFSVLALIAAVYEDFEALLAPRRAVRNWAGQLVGRVQSTSELAEYLAMLPGKLRAWSNIRSDGTATRGHL